MGVTAPKPAPKPADCAARPAIVLAMGDTAPMPNGRAILPARRDQSNPSGAGGSVTRLASEDGGRAWDLQPSVHFRAGGKAIVGWCDGHVSLEPPQSYGETNYYGGDNKKDKVGWFGPEEDNGFWNPHSAAVLNGWSPEEAESIKKGGARDEDGPDSADSTE